MLSYLQGKIIAIVNPHTNRRTLILEVQGIGYEIQIAGRFAQALESEIGTAAQIFTHWQLREEQLNLYGFATAAERDLFRQLISIAGVGPQLAIAVLDTLGLEGLQQAIATGNLRMLCKTPGVGQKTAERLTLELKNKLALPRTQDKSRDEQKTILQEVEATLESLGYSDGEIDSAIAHLLANPQLRMNKGVEESIKEAIAFLTQLS